MGVQLHAPTPLPLEKIPCYPLKKGWVVHRYGDEEKILALTGKRTKVAISKQT
jgi:hypothetical protein